EDEIKRNTAAKRYRVLALDGGGVKGTYTAAVLCTLERITGKSIGQYFDLITGTSTGGIIAVAIGMGLPLARILDLYVSQGDVIFPCPAPGWRGKLASCWRHLRRPKHSHQILRTSLEEVMNGRLFG